MRERPPRENSGSFRAVYQIADVAVIPTYVQAAADVGVVVNVLATEGQQYTALNSMSEKFGKPYTGPVPEGKSYVMISGMPATGDLAQFWARVKELEQSEAAKVEANNGVGTEVTSDARSSFKDLTDRILANQEDVRLSLNREQALTILNTLRQTSLGKYLLPQGSLFGEDKNIRNETFRDADGTQHYEDEEPTPTATDQELVGLELSSHHETPYEYDKDGKPVYFWFRHLGLSFVYEREGTNHQGIQDVVMYCTQEDAKKGMKAPRVEVNIGIDYRDDEKMVTTEMRSRQGEFICDETKENEFLTVAAIAFNLAALPTEEPFAHAEKSELE
ncbi:MAG TPA: hypothetical protein VMR59_02135 [Patescibacteria group bacterium]|jgi:hypothetical protein|nr:hypothetical protein [Patescibacteria group bacterium]